MKGVKTLNMKIFDKNISLEGRTALITGARSGIGFATTKLFAEYGASIAMIGSSNAEDKADELRKEGYDISFFQCNVREEDQVIKTVNAVKDKFGSINILFNNAGIIIRKSILDMSVDEWDLMMEVNLRGPFLMTKYTLPIMIEQGGGSIINTGSSAAFKATSEGVAYDTTKSGIVNFTRSIALDYGKYNIRCNSINPGGTETPMLRSEAVQEGIAADTDDSKGLKQYYEMVAESRPLERIGTAEEMAYAALFFASDMSSWATGSAIVVDGGRLA